MTELCSLLQRVLDEMMSTALADEDRLAEIKKNIFEKGECENEQ